MGIPGFIDRVGDKEYLKSLALKYFENHPNKEKAIEIFAKSLSSGVFDRDLNQAVARFKESQLNNNNFYSAEAGLRVPLTIFRQAKALQEYVFPEESTQERASKKM